VTPGRQTGAAVRRIRGTQLFISEVLYATDDGSSRGDETVSLYEADLVLPRK
jgi:hypothetical protein